MQQVLPDQVLSREGGYLRTKRLVRGNRPLSCYHKGQKQQEKGRGEEGRQLLQHHSRHHPLPPDRPAREAMSEVFRSQAFLKIQGKILNIIEGLRR